jgi:hypothetical protein
MLFIVIFKKNMLKLLVLSFKFLIAIQFFLFIPACEGVIISHAHQFLLQASHVRLLCWLLYSAVQLYHFQELLATLQSLD